MKKWFVFVTCLLVFTSVAYAQTVSIDDFKVVLIDSIKDYLQSQTPKLEKNELKDLIVAYLTASDVVDLSKIGKFSGKKLSEIYNKAKGITVKMCSESGGACKENSCSGYNNCNALSATCASGYCCTGRCTKGELGSKDNPIIVMDHYIGSSGSMNFFGWPQSNWLWIDYGRDYWFLLEPSAEADFFTADFSTQYDAFYYSLFIRDKTTKEIIFRVPIFGLNPTLGRYTNGPMMPRQQYEFAKTEWLLRASKNHPGRMNCDFIAYTGKGFSPAQGTGDYASLVQQSTSLNLRLEDRTYGSRNVNHAKWETKYFWFFPRGARWEIAKDLTFTLDSEEKMGKMEYKLYVLDGNAKLIEGPFVFNTDATQTFKHAVLNQKGDRQYLFSIEEKSGESHTYDVTWYLDSMEKPWSELRPDPQTWRDPWEGT